MDGQSHSFQLGELPTAEAGRRRQAADEREAHSISKASSAGHASGAHSLSIQPVPRAFATSMPHAPCFAPPPRSPSARAHGRSRTLPRTPRMQHHRQCTSPCPASQSTASAPCLSGSVQSRRAGERQAERQSRGTLRSPKPCCGATLGSKHGSLILPRAQHPAPPSLPGTCWCSRGRSSPPWACTAPSSRAQGSWRCWGCGGWHGEA